MQFATAENNLNKQKCNFITSLKETYNKNCSEYEEARDVLEHAGTGGEYEKAVAKIYAERDKDVNKAYDECKKDTDDICAQHEKALAANKDPVPVAA